MMMTGRIVSSHAGSMNAPFLTVKLPDADLIRLACDAAASIGAGGQSRIASSITIRVREVFRGRVIW
jgi:hypothetical protein